MALVYIGLGSNLGDREGHIARAARELSGVPGIRIIRESSLEETKPVDLAGQPDFINRVILVETGIAPRDLLNVLQGIETVMGRERTIAKGPRIIDLDVLLYGSEIIDTDDLKVPHPEIRRRPFVLKHLLELDPGLVDPLTGTRYREVYDAAHKEHQ